MEPLIGSGQQGYKWAGLKYIWNLSAAEVVREGTGNGNA